VAAHDLGEAPRRTSIAVALGGGGARGYAHIGILQVLEERHLEIVSIAGSSMGALVGGLYAADGLAPFAAWVRGLTHRDVLRLYDLAPRAPGAIRAERIFARVSDILGDVRIEDLPLDFTAVATDLEAGEERWLRTGPVDAAIRASAALPGFMTPVVMHGRLLADGGLTNPLPIAPTIAAHADLTVAVAVSGRQRLPSDATAASPRSCGDVLRGLGTRLAARRGAPTATQEPADAGAYERLPPGLRTLDVMGLSLGAVRTAVMRHTLAANPPDVLITIPRSCCRTLDFHKADELIALGRRLATEALDREERIPRAVPPEAVRRSTESRPLRVSPDWVVRQSSTERPARDGGRELLVPAGVADEESAMSESVTWENCPTCERPAAVGWLDGSPVEFDCPSGCDVDAKQLSAFADRRRPAMEWLTGT
jgi:NTE family protein